MEISATIKFRDICKMMERVKVAKDAQRKELVLKRYYASFSKHRNEFRKSNSLESNTPEDGSSSFYSVLRLLIPGADRGRDNYGLQITNLGKLYTRVLQLAKDSDDAKRLMHRSFSSFRDYADVVHAVLLPRCHNEPSNLTLKQIHDMLDLIANEDTTVKERELIRFTELASAEEQKWLIRILLKSMGLGIGEQRIFGLLHPLAKDMYQRCTDLKRVCSLLADDKLSVSMEEPSGSSNTSVVVDLNTFIEPFQQIRPMLCERFPGKIKELMKSDVLYLETKMDGERFQLHYARGTFKYISRNGVDYTVTFGDTYECGTLTPHLKPLLPLGMESIILDGEMMVWDNHYQRYREKSENTDVKHLNPISCWRPCFVVYDLLYLNGESYLDMPYVQRAYKLQELLNEKQGVLEVMKGTKVKSLKHFYQLFQEKLEAFAEGIVVKKQNSIYKPGVRAGGGWYKDKADYVEGLVTEFDVLIIGGFYNRKRTFIDSFLLGVLKPGGDQKHDHVYSIGCVANNTRQRTLLHHELSAHWHNSSTDPPPLWFHYKPNEKEGCPDVWIEPDKSMILQVRATDLTPNRAFFTPKSLHFPRTQLVRDDKVWNECMTLMEYSELSEGPDAIRKLDKRPVELNDFTTDRKRQKLTPAARNRLGLATYEKRFDFQPIVNGSQLFNGFSFCILSGDRRHSKQQLQKLAAENGGTIVQNPLPNDSRCICICGDRTYLVERMMLQKPRVHDILHLNWLIRVCEKQVIGLRPKDVLSATEALEKQFKQSFDKLGDSYTDELSNREELKEVLNDITKSEVASYNIDQSELQQLKKELLGKKKSKSIFANYRCYFYPKNKDKLAKLLFQQHGGQWRDIKELDSYPRVVVIDKLDLKDFQLAYYCNSTAVKVVTTAWIRESHKARRLLPIDNFIAKKRNYRRE